MQLHEKLKTLRQHHYYTQQDIADRLGVTRSTISNFEIGRRKPEVDVLEKLAAIYGVDLNYFANNDIHSSDLLLLVEKAETIFNDPNIPEETKDKVYQSLMKVYLAMKEGKMHHERSKHTL
jgi:transcriptional regulator with XRE-family HTH domain